MHVTVVVEGDSDATPWVSGAPLPEPLGVENTMDGNTAKHKTMRQIYTGIFAVFDRDGS